MTTTVEITIILLSLSSIPEKVLLVSRDLLTVEMIWFKIGTPRENASWQVKMKNGMGAFTTESRRRRSWMKKVANGRFAVYSMCRKNYT